MQLEAMAGRTRGSLVPRSGCTTLHWGEGIFHVLPDKKQVVVFEVPERAKLEYYQNGHNLTVGKRGLAVAAYLTRRGQK